MSASNSQDAVLAEQIESNNASSSSSASGSSSSSSNRGRYWGTTAFLVALFIYFVVFSSGRPVIQQPLSSAEGLISPQQDGQEKDINAEGGAGVLPPRRSKFHNNNNKNGNNKNAIITSISDDDVKFIRKERRHHHAVPPYLAAKFIRMNAKRKNSVANQRSPSFGPALQCEALLNHSSMDEIMQELSNRKTRGERISIEQDRNRAPCLATATSLSAQARCADSWLEQCWTREFSKSSKAQQLECNPQLVRQFVGFDLKFPRKPELWRENSFNFILQARFIFKNDVTIARTGCALIEEVSRRLCYLLPRRELDVQFVRSKFVRPSSSSSSNNKKEEKEKQQQSSVNVNNRSKTAETGGNNDNDEEANFMSTASLSEIAVEDQFTTDLSIKVLESFEFQDTFASSSSSSKQTTSTNSNNDDDDGIVVDLVMSGMFHRNAEYAKILFSAVDEQVLSKFQFRHRHFFMWNSQRAPFMRHSKSENLYGEKLTKRMDSLRDAAQNRFQTWIVLDVESFDKSELTSFFPHVLILRGIAAEYLAALPLPSFTKNFPLLERRRSRASRRMADYIVWLRPDLTYHIGHLAQIRRVNPYSPTGELHIVSKPIHAFGKRLNKRYVFSRHDTTNHLLVQDIDKGFSTKRDKVTDLIMIGNASSMLTIYASVLDMLHSCLWLPPPKQFFIEYFLRTGAKEANAHVEFLQFGATIDRGGGETLPPEFTEPARVAGAPPDATLGGGGGGERRGGYSKPKKPRGRK